MFSKVTFLGVLFATNAMAAMPFTISGDKIEAIFQSEKLWKKVGGAVESITFKGHEKNTSTFAFTTTEVQGIPSPTASGVTIGYKQVPCLVLVKVTAEGDEFTPKWAVSDVDYSACPSVR